MPVIGYLGAGSSNARVWLVDAFRQGLRENGYVEGRDVAIDSGESPPDATATRTIDALARCERTMLPPEEVCGR